jgi:hypothetical protein
VESKPASEKTPIPVFIRDYESRFRMDVATYFPDDQDDQFEIAIQIAKEWKRRRKAGIEQPLKPPSGTPEYE